MCVYVSERQIHREERHREERDKKGETRRERREGERDRKRDRERDRERDQRKYEGGQSRVSACSAHPCTVHTHAVMPHGTFRVGKVA